jgi:hypothetical protein
MISGFTFVHNALSGGYPIEQAIESVRPYVDEIVAVDMQSTDGTRDLLFDTHVVSGAWDCKAGETLANAHRLHTECQGDIIVHFEADEIWSPTLLAQAIHLVKQGQQDIAVYRLQLEQNFQRCRWYPEPVHRVFPRGSVTKEGHTTDRHNEAVVIRPEWGYLWDVTNCFKSTWKKRIEQQAELRQDEPNYLHVPLHATGKRQMVSGVQIEEFLIQDHWTWNRSPFDLPDILLPLVGNADLYETDYR